MSGNIQESNNMLSRLNNLKERTKSRTVPVRMEVATSRSKEERDVVNVEAPYQEPEIAPEVNAQRIKDDEQFKEARTLVESVIPQNPITLKVKTEFTPEHMNEQVRNDYTGMIRQSINSSLDKLTVFYMQGNRFKESKDMRIFLLKSIQDDIASLKSQYVAKYPLISGLEQVIIETERKYGNEFKAIVDDFIRTMTRNSFSE